VLGLFLEGEEQNEHIVDADADQDEREHIDDRIERHEVGGEAVADHDG